MPSQKEKLKRSNLLFSTEKNKNPKISIPRKVFSITIYSIILIGLIYLVFFSNIFLIDKVKVENAKSVEIEDYIKVSLYRKNNLLLMPGNYLEDLTRKYPVIEEASLQRGLPNKVKVTLKERDYEFMWCNKSDCYQVDNRGYVIDETTRASDNIPIIDLRDLPVETNKKVVSNKFVSFYINSLEMFNGLGITIKEARISDTTFKVEFETSDGWIAILDSSSSLENQFSALKQVLEKNKDDINEYVDVRVEGVVFVR